MTQIVSLLWPRQQSVFAIIFSAFLAFSSLLTVTNSQASVQISDQCVQADFQSTESEDESDTDSTEDEEEEEDDEPDCD